MTEPAMFAPTFKAKAPAAGVWSPNNSKSSDSTKNTEKIISVEKSTTKTTKSGEEPPPPPLPVWSPSSAGPSPTAERKEFRPLKFESPVLSRKSLPKTENSSTPEAPVSPPWQQTESIASSLSASLDRRLTSSQSAPGGSLNTLSGTRLPRAQNPTITLLQKAREGQLPRGASYLEENQKIPKDTKPGIIAPNEIIYTVKSEYTSEPETEREKPKKMADLGPRKFEGIGPTTKDGMPIVLRSEVKENNQAKWYKRMYDTLHKAKNDGLRYPYSGNGYLSEPEPQGYDSDVNVKYNTLDRRRAPSVGAAPDHSSTMPRLSRSHVKYETDVYKNQPGRIEDYVPGHSSISERETKEWWDEVMDIFDGHLEQQRRVPTINPRSYMSHALKESGYESDSQLIFRRRDDTAQQLSPVEQRQAYKSLQAGGDPPLQGFRKPAPERPKDDSDIEYFPISPTLTRIRIHKNSVKPPKEISCFPITKVPSPPTNVFSKYEQHTSSYLQVTPPNPPPLPPSPPNRRSSKHNNTLRLYSTVKVSSSQSPGRHESCFTTETDKSNVQFLKDRLTYKMSSHSPRLSRKSQTEECQRHKSRTVSVSPISRICNTSNGKKSADKTKLSKKVCDLHLNRRVASSSPISRPLKTDTFTRRTTPSPVAFGRAVSSERTFASEKRKLESAGKLKRDETPTRIMRSPELTSPKEVKKVLQNQKNAKITTNRTVKHLPPGTTVKSSTTLYSSTRNGSRHSPKTDEKALRVTVAISARGKELLRASTETPKFCRSSRTTTPRVVSPVVTKSTVKKCCRSELSPSPLSSRSRFKSTSSLPTSFRSLSRDSKVSVSSETNRRLIRTTTSETKRRVEKYCPVIAKPVTITKSSASKGEPFQIIGKVKQDSDKEKKKTKKNKKDEKKLNGKSKLNGDKRKTKKCAGRAAGSEIVKELKKMESSVETSSFGSFENLIADEIHQQREAIRSDSFFQNLFLRDISPTPSMASSLYRNTSVLEKARMWSNLSYKSEPSLRQTNVYLSQKKPVTESKFRNLDRESQPVSRASSRGVSWPGRHVATQIQKFDSLRGFDDEEDEFGSNVVYRARSPEINEVLKERSKSEPPPKTVLTETVRPHSPVVRRSSPDHSRKSVSPSPIRSPAYRRIHNARLAQHKNAECVETSKRKTARARSEGDADIVSDYTESQILSTAQSANSLNSTKIAEHQEYQAYVTELVHSNRKSNRFRELNKFYENLQRVGELERATSSSDLRPRRKDEEIIDFDRWKQVRAQERAEHELNMLYGKLKLAQKEKDLLFRPHDAELLKWKRDRDRGLRIKEKSVEDLKDHFQKLSVEESDLEASRRREIEARKDVYKPLWRGNSVVNLATSMVEKRNPTAIRERVKSIPTRQEKVTGMHGYHISSRLWSSLSVDQVNTLKNQLSEIYSNGSPKQIEKEEDIKEYVITVPPNIKQMDTSLHVRSSSLLTKDQMFAPSTSKQETKRALKAESIGSINIASVSTIEKSESSKKDPSLSEGEKRRISQTLSQEIMNKISQRSQARSPIVLAKETRGAIAAASARLPGPETSSPRTCYSLEMSEDGNLSPTRRTFKEKTDFVLVLTPKEDVVQHKREIKEVLDEWAQPKTSSVEHTVTTSAATATTTVRQTSTTSETESASSETSNRTVIYRPPSEVKSKVDYFEKAKQEQSVGTVIYHARDDSSEATPTVEITEVVVEPPPVEEKVKTKKQDTHFGRLVPSQSVADFKELYGEREIYKLATTPLSSRFKTGSRSDSMSPDRKHVEFSPRTDNISPMRGLSNGSSFDSIYRSRSISPDPERYWRAYLNLVKTGDVRRLKDKFEYCDEHAGFATLRPRRINSDPELTRTLLNKRGTKSNRVTIREQETVDVGRMAWKYETRCSRGRSRTRRGRVVSPIPKIPLRPEDRFMPHINVISKLASLSPRSATVPSRKTGQKIASMLGCQTGEVEKIKDKFEKRDRNMSIMGQMFTSTPDMHELRDIAPYLAASWAAHQYPKRQDNSRSLSSPETLPKDAEVPIKKERQRPKSTSPPRPKQKPLSILKPQTSKSNVFAHQPFNASIHRPKYRYQPDAPKIQSGTWWPKLPVYPAKPSVTFKEPDVAPPPPPPKGVPMTGDYRPESPRRYVDSEVTIHYRSPVRHETKDALPEEELARRQAEAMRRIYQEERRRKYLQELQDMNSRRHTDNFIPSQKSPIPLNRYDDLTDDLTFRTTKITRGSPEPRLVAKALYNFVGQTSRELSFKKGDIIFVRRQVDKNWYEGEHNAMIGLFPFNYVEIIPYEGIRTIPRKLSEGQARAKFNFIAQTALELSLLKGELVTLTRRVDDNWFEGKIANRKGIFPVSYVEILSDVGERIEPKTITSSKPVASPAAHSLLVNGSSGGKQSMGQHHYTPQYNPSGTHHARPASAGPVGSPAGYGSLPRGGKEVHQTLHVDTHSEAVPYRALYKYRPQNSDELELVEGDTVFVLEKCDDGWYVGSSQRTGCFGTFPGNYVERL